MLRDRISQAIATPLRGIYSSDFIDEDRAAADARWHAVMTAQPTARPVIIRHDTGAWISGPGE